MYGVKGSHGESRYTVTEIAETFPAFADHTTEFGPASG
jgi:hypothetical protein